MVALHAGFLLSSVAEVWLLDRPFRPVLAAAMVLLLAVGMAVRFWSLQTLGDRWMTRVMVVPGESVVVSGPYRFMRHPNYLAVVVEIAAIPLIHGAWITAVVFSVLDGVMLAIRISVEERALRRHTGWTQSVRSGEAAS
jgi:methyltransferase